MQQPYKNKTYTTYDYFVIAIGCLIFAVLFMCYQTCNEPKPVLHGIALKEEFNAAEAQGRYDSLSLVTAKQMDSLEQVIAEVKKNNKQIIIRTKELKDTIYMTADSNQIKITKMLCPSAGDSANLREINYCLADGKQAEELYKNSLNEINALESEVKLNKGLVNEGLENMASKDTLNSVYKNANENLSEGLEKEKHRKKVWRNYSCGATIIATIFALIIAL